MPRNLFLKARHNEGADEKTSNLKYEITDITHEEYPFLHRIRALQDVGDQVKAGDLGGFVEGESNLATDPSDCAWIFDDAIAAGNAYVSHGSVLSNHARAEDDAYLRGAVMNGSARVSGCAQIISVPSQFGTPLLSGHCQVYGSVRGDVHVTGTAVILPGEEILNDTKDTLVLTGTGRSVIRGRGRESIAPSRTLPAKEKKPKKWRMER